MSNIGYKISGGYPVVGKVRCMGAKNLATKAMVASLLSKEKTILNNIPAIGDVEITKYLLESSGVVIKNITKNSIEIDPGKLEEHEASLPDSRTNRIPILLLGVLLHKFGKAVVPTVGGDHIGKRNVDFHINAIKDFGAKVEKKADRYIAYADNRLKGCHVELPYPSVGATETCLFLSVLAEGTSVIKNIAIEPEIVELITMLRSMGAIIFLSSGREVMVQGVEKLKGTNIHIIGDRIEAASWASLACASDGSIEVSGIRPELLGNFLSYFAQVGGGYEFVDSETILFYRKQALKPVTIETDVYPGFTTDWQQPFAMILTQADGISVIHETVHEKRFGYLNILNQLGVTTEAVTACLGPTSCRYHGFDHYHSALIHGPAKLSSGIKPIKVPDLRAGLAYLIAAALAKGTTTLLDVEQIERGYGDLIEKLCDTNLKVKKFSV